MKRAGVSNRLTDITGIGPATAEQLADRHGIETARQLATSLFGEDATWIDDTLQQTENAISELVAIVHQVGMDNTGVSLNSHQLAHAMALHRVAGISHSFLDYGGYTGVHPNNYEIPATGVDWTRGFTTGRFNAVAHVHDWEMATDTFGDIRQAISAQPTVKTKTGTHTTFTTGEASTRLGNDFIDTVEQAVGIDVRTQNERLAIHPTEDDCIAIVELKGANTAYLIAPRVRR